MSSNIKLASTDDHSFPLEPHLPCLPLPAEQESAAAGTNLVHPQHVRIGAGAARREVCSKAGMRAREAEEVGSNEAVRCAALRLSTGGARGGESAGPSGEVGSCKPERATHDRVFGQADRGRKHA